MTDIVAELRRKIGDRDGDDGVIGVTFGEMRSLLDAVDTLRWYADRAIELEHCENYAHVMEWQQGLLADGGKRARTALAALKRSDEG